MPPEVEKGPEALTGAEGGKKVVYVRWSSGWVIQKVVDDMGNNFRALTHASLALTYLML